MRKFQFLLPIILAFSFTSSPSKKMRWEFKSQLADPVNIDTKLLKEAVIEYVNFRRQKTRKNQIQSNLYLDSIIGQFNTKYKNKDLYKKRKKVRQNFYSKAWDLGYTNSWFKIMYSESSTLLVSGKSIYFNSELNGFCWGTKKSLRDTNIKPILVPKLTYRQLAKRLVSRSLPGSNRRWINTSGVDKIGIQVNVNEKGFPYKLPSIELIFIVSGNVMPTKL
ncbi:MAG: hypothetical protein CMP61_01950 [Flavobacteriales bacterium]|nr:hypothetical protein [Flavobacteriales bacterium]|tara:strand:- start:17874 stop:18536 length:663 start_codon:yes stop_codon:yes gene_type:complete